MLCRWSWKMFLSHLGLCARMAQLLFALGATRPCRGSSKCCVLAVAGQCAPLLAHKGTHTSNWNAPFSGKMPNLFCYLLFFSKLSWRVDAAKFDYSGEPEPTYSCISPIRYILGHCCYWLWGKSPTFGWFLNSFSQGKSKLVNANFCNFSRLTFVLKLTHRT